MQSKYHAITHAEKGRSHIKNSTPCQDYAYEHITDNIAIIALADGAGSAKYSELGAQCVTETIASMLEQEFDNYYNDNETNSIAQAIIASLNKELEQLSKDTTEQLKPKGDETFKGIIKNMQEQLDEIKRIDINQYDSIMQDIKTALNKQQENIGKKLKDIENELQHYKQNNERLEQQENFKKAFEQELNNYEKHRDDAKKSLIKILKKQKKDKGWLKKIWDWLYDKSHDLTPEEEQKIEEIIQSIPEIAQQQQKTQRAIESLLKEQVALREQIDDKNHRDSIFEKLDAHNKSIIKTIQETYEGIESTLEQLNKKNKSISNEQHLKSNNHTLPIQDNFKNIIQEFLSMYQDCIKQEKKEREALKNKQKTAQKEQETLQFKINGHDRLKKEIVSHMQTLKANSDTLHKALQELNSKNKDEFCTEDNKQYIESIAFESFKKSLNIVKNFEQKILAYAKQYNIPQKGIQLPSIDDQVFDKDKLIKAIEESICTIKDLSSTLLFAAIKDDRCLIGHIGDGAIGGLYENELRVISNPDNGEHSNETFFVTTKNAHKVLKLNKGNVREKNIKAFVLMSDGSTEGLYSKRDKKFVEALQRHVIEITKQDKDKKQKDIEALIQKVRDTKSFDVCSIAIHTCVEKRGIKI